MIRSDHAKNAFLRWGWEDAEAGKDKVLKHNWYYLAGFAAYCEAAAVEFCKDSIPLELKVYIQTWRNKCKD